jgi:N-acetylglucosaminyl-diphospho-decaprenol L-rhamnosyltransferase
MTPGVSVIVVVFNSSSTVRACLESVPLDCEVVVVDQLSSDGSVQIARETRPDATIIRSERNAGYSAGCNVGARNSRGETLVFLNPDAAFLAQDAPHHLARSAQAKNALVAPIVLDPDCSDVTLVKKLTTVTAQARRLLTLQRPNTGFRSLSDCEYVSGPVLAISAQSFHAVGGFDERFFLYREEETLARRLGKIGVGCFLDPQVTVSHIGGVSTSQVPEFAFRQGVRSESLFYVLHFPKSAAALVTFLLVIRLLVGFVAAPLLRHLRVRPRARPALWYLRATPEVVRGWRAHPVEPPDLPTQV